MIRPAVSIAKSISPDFIICLEDGKRFKTLKRHLREAFGMSPEEYRAKWRLPPDYPMTAPTYAKQRSQIARSIEGRKRRQVAPRNPTPGGWPIWRGE